MTSPLWKRKSNPQPDLETDVLIVGGGFVGLSTAFWLKRIDPSLKVTIIEQNICGSGASGRNAGFLTKGSATFYQKLANDLGEDRSNAILEYARDSIDLLHQLVLSKSSVQIHEATSSFTLVRRDQTVQQKEFLAMGFEWLEVKKMNSIMSKNYSGAIVSANEFKVNPVLLLDHLRIVLEDTDVRIIEDTQGYKISGTSLVTDHCQIHAQKVVLAMNGYSSQFSGAFKEIISPRRAQMLAVRLENELNCKGLYYDSRERVYWRMADERTLLVGGKRLLDEAEEKGEYDKISQVIQDGLEEYLKGQLSLNFKVVCRWSGLMGFTNNELPLITRSTGNKNVVIVGGFSGHGMGLGFKAAQEVAELITERKEFSFFNSFNDTKIKI